MVMERIDAARIKVAKEAADATAVTRLGRELGGKLDAAIYSHPDTKVYSRPLYRLTNKPFAHTLAYRQIDKDLLRETGPVPVRVRLLYPEKIINPSSLEPVSQILISFPKDSQEVFLLDKKGEHIRAKWEKGTSIRDALSGWGTASLEQILKAPEKLSLLEAEKLRDNVVLPLLSVLTPGSPDSLSFYHRSEWKIPPISSEPTLIPPEGVTLPLPSSS